MPDKTTQPATPRVGCHFCDGTGITNQSSYDQAVADGLERIAWKPGTRCLCTYTWAEIAPAVAEIYAEVENGRAG